MAYRRLRDDKPLPSPPTTTEPSSGGSQRAAFSVATAKGRAGAPGPLRKLPIDSAPSPASLPISEVVKYTEDLTNKAYKILSQYRVEVDDVDFLPLANTWGRVFNAQPTILINAPCTPDCREAWIKAVREIKIYADEKLQNADYFSTGDVAVDMIDPKQAVGGPKYMGPILNNYPLEHDWPMIRREVREILESYHETRVTWNTIAVFRLGHCKVVDQNPMTVYVSVDRSPQHAERILQGLQGYLDSLAHDLTAHMEQNEIDLYDFELLPPTGTGTNEVGRHFKWPPDKYTERVGLGDDLGASAYIVRSDHVKLNPGYGTLGCYLDIKTKRVPEWKRYVLTNYHVLRPCFDGFILEAVPSNDNHNTVKGKVGDPRQNSALLEADSRGFSPNVPPGERHLVESPNRRMHNQIVDQYKDMLRGPGGNMAPHTRQECQADLDEKVDFFNNGKHIFGKLYAGSGFGRRSQTNGRLDWCLIEVKPGRDGTNSLPDKSDWYSAKHPEDFKPRWWDDGATLKPLPPAQSLRKMERGDLVYKKGARTGITVGVLDRQKPSCRLSIDRHMNPRHSTEYLFFPAQHPWYEDDQPRGFADYGDSGAAVYNRSGQIVGILFSGQSPGEVLGSRLFTYITPIEDIFADIKDYSKGEITHVRVSKS